MVTYTLHITGSKSAYAPTMILPQLLMHMSVISSNTNKLLPLHSVSERTREILFFQIGCLGYNISSQARSRYSSLAAVLGSKTPRQVPAVLKYLLMINVISLQPIFTLLCFALFTSESTTLCLSPPRSRSFVGAGDLL